MTRTICKACNGHGVVRSVGEDQTPENAPDRMSTPRDIPLHTDEIIREAEGAGWNQSLMRLRVEGGWLYTCQINSIRGVSISSSFVPDGVKPNV